MNVTDTAEITTDQCLVPGEFPAECLLQYNLKLVLSSAQGSEAFP